MTLETVLAAAIGTAALAEDLVPGISGVHVDLHDASPSLLDAIVALGGVREVVLGGDYLYCRVVYCRASRVRGAVVVAYSEHYSGPAFVESLIRAAGGEVPA